MADDRERQKPLPPSLLAPLNSGPPNFHISEALQAGSDALLAVDAFRIGQRLQMGQPLGPMTLFSAYWLLTDVTNKIPPTIHYYSHGFRQEVPTVYVMPGLALFTLHQALLGEFTHSIANLVDKYIGVVESAVSVLRAKTWSQVGLRTMEAYFRGKEAAETAEELGDLVPLSSRDIKQDAMIDYQPSWRDLPESLDPSWNQGEAYRGNDPNEINHPIEQPGMGDNRKFDA